MDKVESENVQTAAGDQDATEANLEGRFVSNLGIEINPSTPKPLPSTHLEERESERSKWPGDNSIKLGPAKNWIKCLLEKLLSWKLAKVINIFLEKLLVRLTKMKNEK